MCIVPTDSVQQRQEPEAHEEGGELQEAGQLLGSLPGHHPHQRRVQEAAPRTPLYHTRSIAAGDIKGVNKISQ